MGYEYILTTIMFYLILLERDQVSEKFMEYVIMYNLDDYFEGFSTKREREDWQDVMQVCINGHLINGSSKKYPKYNKDYCDECGEKTIVNCPNCNKPIPGSYHKTGIVSYSDKVPAICQYCGKPYPWKKSNEEEVKQSIKECPIDYLIRLFSRFHKVAFQLAECYKKRATIKIQNEYDVQYLLHSLLHLYFDDIRTEEYTPSYAGNSTRMDFLLKEENIVIEVKVAKKGRASKEIGKELINDIAHYKKHSNCNILVCFIYQIDPVIINHKELKDLEDNKELEVKIFINP